MKSVMRRATAPLLPKRVLAANAEARPAEIWLEEGGFGYVGKEGLSVNATAAKPSVVANPKGMANHARPPRM